MQNAQRREDSFGAGIAADILSLAEQSLQEVRTLSYLLHPPLLDEIGLEAALRWLAKGFGERSGIATEVDIDDLSVTPAAEVATAIFRVAQEALANVHRHSGSLWARISLRLQRGSLELRIEDGGRGMAAGTEGETSDMQSVGVGVSGMRVRLAQLGGRLELVPRQPGLLVRALLPAPSNPAAAGLAGADPAT
jgi:signal transduction histidine kinase